MNEGAVYQDCQPDRKVEYQHENGKGICKGLRAKDVIFHILRGAGGCRIWKGLGTYNVRLLLLFELRFRPSKWD